MSDPERADRPGRIGISSDPAPGWNWLIVGGCPRSGTTLLQLVLNTNASIRLTNEMSLVNAAEALRPAFARESSFAKTRERAKNHKENWDKASLAPFIPRYDRCAGPMLRAMFEAQFRDQVAMSNVRFFGDKYPRYYEQDLDALEALIGPLWILHVSRDPVDVVNSMLRRSRNAKLNLDAWRLVHTLEEACMHWVRAWNAVQRFALQRGSRVLHVKYEDVVDCAPQGLDEISRRLGVANAFDTRQIVAEDPVARDLLSSTDIDRINELVGGIAARWSAPLDILTASFPAIAEPVVPST